MKLLDLDHLLNKLLALPNKIFTKETQLYKMLQIISLKSAQQPLQHADWEVNMIYTSKNYLRTKIQGLKMIWKDALKATVTSWLAKTQERWPNFKMKKPNKRYQNMRIFRLSNSVKQAIKTKVKY